MTSLLNNKTEIITHTILWFKDFPIDELAHVPKLIHKTLVNPKLERTNFFK